MGVYVAFLEDHGGVAEDEVYRAVDVAFTVELALGVDVEGVLVPDDLAIVYHAVIGADSERHRLVLAWSRRVLERNVLGYETCPCRRCIYYTQNFISPKNVLSSPIRTDSLVEIYSLDTR